MSTCAVARAHADRPTGEPTTISMRPSVGSASGMSSTPPPIEGTLPITVSTALRLVCFEPSTLISTRCGLVNSSGIAENT